MDRMDRIRHFRASDLKFETSNLLMSFILYILSIPVNYSLTVFGERKEMAVDRRSDSRTAEGGQRGLVAHAVLVGLTPLIPVPVVDDLAKNYFRRRLVRGLAAASGRALSDAEFAALLKERERGCLRGCLTAVVVYPLKATFRKVFYFLEWKRAVDLASRTYHFGYLVGYALRPREGGATLVDLCGAEADR